MSRRRFIASIALAKTALASTAFATLMLIARPAAAQSEIPSSRYLSPAQVRPPVGAIVSAAQIGPTSTPVNAAPVNAAPGNVPVQSSGPVSSAARAELDPAIEASIRAQVDQLVAERLRAYEEQGKIPPAPVADNDGKSAAKFGLGSVNWRNGFWFETPNKDFTFHIGGTVQYDLGLYAPQQNLVTGPRSIGAVDDGVNVRRGRLRAEGTMWQNIDYRFELEFFNAIDPPGAPAGINRTAEQQTALTTGPTDAWFTLKQLPIVGNVRIGNQKEPIGLDHLEGFRFLPFMERSPLFDFITPTAFNNGFNPGIMLFDTAFNERMTWAIGGFKNSYNVGGFSVDDGNYAATGRLTALPLFEEEGTYLVHLGVAGSHRDPEFGQDRFRVRPSVRSAPGPITPFIPILTDTGFFSMSRQDIMALEFFTNIGPFTVQAEYMGSWNGNSTTAATGNVGATYFQGYYVQALYWLTGEHTRWDKKAAAPDRYVVNNPFYLFSGPDCASRGLGAWQVGVRYSMVDTNNQGINGGMLDDLTVGLNWILNPNVKIQWNYEFAHRYGLGAANNGNFQGFGMRAHFDF